jgi:outer membrane protein OmpA-like peptidoglycan-associated protein
MPLSSTEPYSYVERRKLGCKIKQPIDPDPRPTMHNSYQHDNAQPFALGLVALITAVAVAATVVVGLGRVQKIKLQAAPSSSAGARPVQQQWPQKITFEPGHSHLPESSREPLSMASHMARSNPGSRVQITAFHAPDIQGETNRLDALQRAETVRHGLEANGVSPSQMIVTRPVVVIEPPPAQSSRRVELSVQ